MIMAWETAEHGAVNLPLLVIALLSFRLSMS